MDEMNVKLSHIAVAVPEMEKVVERIGCLALEIDEYHEVPSEQVRAGMVKVAVSSDFRIEYLEPTSEDSPISKFLQKKKNGGLHHLCFEVSNIDSWFEKLKAKDVEILPPGIRTGARGRVLFIHPRDMGGVLVELEELN